jgi:glycosyltransferase involved in cell wall biosynthesis
MRVADASSAETGEHKLKPLLLCFTHLRWSFVYQRPQHLFSRAAKHYRVIYLEDPLYAAIDEPRIDLSAGPGAVTIAVPVLPETTPEKERVALRRQLLDDLLAETGAPDIVWYYTPMALEFSDHIRARVCVYDCMDELTGFRGAPPALRQYEQLLFERADIVFTGGFSLYEAKRTEHDNVHAFPSSIEVAHFAAAREPNLAEPADQLNIPRPRIGYCGVVDERMDLDLVDRLASLLSDCHFMMIGPVAKIEAADLPQRPNLHWLGGKQYDELPRYLASWDLGFMPFALNAATRYISPTKTPEFLAAGLPVVSTPVRDVVRVYGEAGLVEIAGDAAEFAKKARTLLARPRGAWLERVDRHLVTTSWDKTWAGMHELIERERTFPSMARGRTDASERLRESAHV